MNALRQIRNRALWLLFLTLTVICFAFMAVAVLGIALFTMIGLAAMALDEWAGGNRVILRARNAVIETNKMSPQDEARLRAYLSESRPTITPEHAEQQIRGGR